MSRTFCLCCALLICGTACLGQEANSTNQTTESEKASAEKFRAYARETAIAYDLRAGNGGTRKLTLVSEPVIRWSNPLGGQQARGEIFLWTDAGLPAAVLSINEFTGSGGRVAGEEEWCSLADGPLIATGPHSWSPAKGVLIRQPLRDVDSPAETASQRRRQMGDLAARFAGEKTTRAGVTRNLRLLPKPIFRYEPKDSDVLDGALFVLAEATDPEALLALEARRTDATYTWHYAFARMNSVRVTATYNDKLVWDAPELKGTDVYDRSDKAYSAFLRK